MEAQAFVGTIVHSAGNCQPLEIHEKSVLVTQGGKVIAIKIFTITSIIKIL